ncbi:MAG: hypothetical protein WCW17_00300 [Patescibacteria group bacterium]|jgi:predicted nucleic acid-binding protein
MLEEKNKVFYIDTNIALDCATNRNIHTILLIERIKEQNWKCVSSAFLAMEMADYKKDSLFITDRIINKKWETRKVLREVYKKTLRESDYEELSEWLKEFNQRYKIEMYDFLSEAKGWDLAQQISNKYSITAADSIHLASAVLGSLSQGIEIFITEDKDLKQITYQIVKDLKVENPELSLQPMNVEEVKKSYFQPLSIQVDKKVDVAERTVSERW